MAIVSAQDFFGGGTTQPSTQSNQQSANQITQQNTQPTSNVVSSQQFFGDNNKPDNKSLLSKVGDFFTSNTQKFGQTSGEALAAPKNMDLYNEQVKIYSDVNNSLLKAIKAKQALGQDTSRLQDALQQHIKDSPSIEDFLGQDTARRVNETFGQNAEEVGGQALGTALEALSGGALGGLGGEATSVGGKILQGAKVGAGYGAVGAGANAMQQEKDLAGVATDTAIGGLTGATVGAGTAGIGAGLKGLVDTIPNRLVRNAIPGLDKASADYALANKPIGTVGKLFRDSADAVVNLNTQVDTILKHPDLIDEKINTPSLFNEILYGKNGKSQYTDQTLIKVMKSLAPQEARTIDKLASGEASLFEANEIKKALYKQTKKVFTDTSIQSAKKQLGADIATSIADMIKKQAPETKPIFDKMSKEINLRDLLLKQFKKQDADKLIGLYDLGTITAGHALGGIPGAITSEVGRKIIKNPATKFAGAKVLNAIGKTKGLPTIINALNKKI